jgi:UDP-2-acetamido-3-amino-2,3-dideoxy-glucuronate N-acetyltransferase
MGRNKYTTRGHFETQRAPTLSNTIDVTACVEPGCVVGEGTRIWHYSRVLKGSTIGRGCTLGQNVVVGPNVVIGDDCKIQNNVSVYEGVTLEDGVFCGPSMVFTNVRHPRAFISRRAEIERTLVRRGATIGANATIVLGVELGEYCFIAAGAVVTRDAPPFGLLAGVPATQIGWVSHAGEVLGEDLICPRTGDRYRLSGGGLERFERGAATVAWPQGS